MRRANLGQADMTGADLRKADFWMADLGSTRLVQADLHQADLMRAKLEGADLTEANLEGVRNLAIEQLTTVKTLYKCRLDPAWIEAVQSLAPWLFDEPKPEPEGDPLDSSA